jgi:hypothetical protein
MFARHISIRLNPNMLADFSETFEKQILPMLRKQKGFQDEITFSTPGGTEVIAVSLWDSKENAEIYNSNIYPEMLRILAKVAGGTPKAWVSEVLHSTFHGICVDTAATAPANLAGTGVIKAGARTV